MKPYTLLANSDPYKRPLGFRKNERGRFEIFNVCGVPILEFNDLPDDLALEYARLLSNAPNIFQGLQYCLRHFTGKTEEQISNTGYSDKEVCRAATAMVRAKTQGLINYMGKPVTVN